MKSLLTKLPLIILFFLPLGLSSIGHSQGARAWVDSVQETLTDLSAQAEEGRYGNIRGELLEAAKPEIELILENKLLDSVVVETVESLSGDKTHYIKWVRAEKSNNQVTLIPNRISFRRLSGAVRDLRNLNDRSLRRRGLNTQDLILLLTSQAGAAMVNAFYQEYLSSVFTELDRLNHEDQITGERVVEAQKGFVVLLDLMKMIFNRDIRWSRRSSPLSTDSAVYVTLETILRQNVERFAEISMDVELLNELSHGYEKVLSQDELAQELDSLENVEASQVIKRNPLLNAVFAYEYAHDGSTTFEETQARDMVEKTLSSALDEAILRSLREIKISHQDSRLNSLTESAVEWYPTRSDRYDQFLLVVGDSDLNKSPYIFSELMSIELQRFFNREKIRVNLSVLQEKIRNQSRDANLLVKDIYGNLERRYNEREEAIGELPSALSPYKWLLRKWNRRSYEQGIKEVTAMLGTDISEFAIRNSAVAEYIADRDVLEGPRVSNPSFDRAVKAVCSRMLKPSP